MKNELEIHNTYSKNELKIDLLSLSFASAGVSFFRNACFISPATAGFFLASGANCAAIHASKYLEKSVGMESRLLRISLLISMVALSAIALPWVLSVFSLHTFVILSSQTAIEIALFHLAAKVTCYMAFWAILRVDYSLGVKLPSSLVEVKDMPCTQLSKVRDYLIDFPTKAKELDLHTQQGLYDRLQELHLGEIPLVYCSSIGTWTNKDLVEIHKRDISNLPVEQRAQINELFFARGLPPQNRKYKAVELPQLDHKEIERSTTHSQISWAHLSLQLKPELKMDFHLPRLFFQWGLPPARNEWVPLAPITITKRIQEISTELAAWYRNYYKSHSTQWKQLSKEIQSEWEKKWAKIDFSQGYFVYSSQKILQKSSFLRPLLLTASIGIVGFAFYYFLNQGNLPFSLGKESLGEALPHTPVEQSRGLVDPLNYSKLSLDEKDLSPFSISPSINTRGPIASNETIAKIASNLALPSLRTRLFCFLPQLPDNASPLLPGNISTLLPDNVCSLRNISKGLVDFSISPVKEVPISKFSPWIFSEQFSPIKMIAVTTAIFTTAAFIYYFSRKRLDPSIFKVQEKKRNFAPFSSLLHNEVSFSNNNCFEVGKDLQHSQRGQSSLGSPQAVLIGGNWEHVLDGSNIDTIDKILREKQTDKDISIKIGDAVYPLSMREGELPSIRKEDGQIRRENFDSIPNLMRAGESFIDYCEKFKVESNHEQAWSAAKEGIGYIQTIRKGNKLDVPISLEVIRKISWGLMGHAIAKAEGFEHGTFVIKDPSYHLFQTLMACPEVYGRESSHFRKAAICLDYGSLKGYRHFGIDIPNLPPNMRTVLFGKITTINDDDTIYIKFEEWGADFRITSSEKAKHFFLHTFSFLGSQYRRLAGTNQADDTRKEHMREEHRSTIQRLFEKLRENEINPSLNLQNITITQVHKYFNELIDSDLPIPDSLKDEIQLFVRHLEDRYKSKVSRTHGDESVMLNSVLELEIPS